VSYHCGNCGVLLQPDALANGHCPSCGATISPTGDVIANGAPDISQVPTRTPPRPPRDVRLAPPEAQPVNVQANPRNVVVVSPRMTGAGATVALMIVAFVAILLLAGSAALVGLTWGQSHANGVPATSGTPASATAAPATLQPTQAASPSGTPSPGVTGTATPANQPTLAVEPHQIHFTTACVAASAQFTVTNSGGGTLEWSATSSNTLYQLTPASGALSHDQQQAVTVSNITLSGQITIAASGAANAPQTVTITCG
jgi:hypothetical protein